MDDLIITGSSHEFIHNLVALLSTDFALKDLGSLHYFPVIEACKSANGLVRCQSKYICDLLLQANMEGIKPISTPIIAGQPDLSIPLSISLQNITITPPNISYAIGKLFQFMHKPMESHSQALKHLIRYLKMVCPAWPKTVFFSFSPT